jgi:hypothetical protein
MGILKIVDELNAPLLSEETPSAKGLAKYLPAPVLELRAVRSVAKALGRPLADANTNPIAAEFSLPKPIPVLGGPVVLDADARVGLGVHQGGELLFPADDLRDAVTVPSGSAYVSVGLSGRLGASGAGSFGPASLGVTGGASLTTRYFHRVDLAAGSPTLGEALVDAVAHAVIPVGVDDLAALPDGAFASVEAEGALQFSGSADFTSTVNPLATPGLPIVGSAKVTAGASASIAGTFTASGGFELRLSRSTGDTVRFAWYRRQGSSLEIDASASVGIAATIRDSDVIKKFVEAVSGDPKADLEELINANLDDTQIETLQKAIAESINRSLRIAVELQFSSVRNGEALFAFDLDVASLDSAGRSVVDEALRGRLDVLQAAAAANAPGIRAVHTGILRTRERRTAWRVNLLGIINVSSVAELVSKGTLSYDPLTGELNAADAITSQRILVSTRPFESEGEKVRKLVLESVMVTAAYQASRVTAQLSLASRCSYFELRAKTSARDLREDFNTIVALALADSLEASRRIGDEHDFGRSTFLAECAFDQQACDALFLGPDGPRPVGYYERTGRTALMALIPADDEERAHRRRAVADEARWAAMKSAGPAAIKPQLAGELGPQRAEHVIGDFALIVWWAEAMSRAASALVEMRRFINGRSAASLAGDPEFKKRRTDLENALARVVKDSKARFGDPWGLVALDLAARHTSAAQATIASQKLLAFFDARVEPASRIVPLAAPTSRGLGQPARRREAPRPLTADEREALRRHAINLRMGALSDSGEIQTTEADVDRLFNELLPAEIEARKAEGLKVRLLFYAHGGLIGEREGLEPVLARLKFWRRNNVYPVSFIWETGLRESIMDIVHGLGATREVAARGIGEDLADAVLEVAGRQGGKAVWSQMKRSAEVAVVEGGGGVLVAQRVRDLWNAHHEDLEIHAAGHSAGSIFHAHFLPALLAQKVGAGVPSMTIKTLHLLAPAATTDLFKTELMDRVGSNKGIESLTMYTMNKSLEQDDTAGPYRKSLLYFVSRSFETAVPTPILGLEESLRDDLKLVRLFGLAGHQKRADVVFSKTPGDAPMNSRTLSTSHGGFDDDEATMTSVIRRILAVPDEIAVVNFFQEPLQPVRSVVTPVPTSPGELGTAPAFVDAGGGMGAMAASGSAPSRQPQNALPSGSKRAVCVGIDEYPAPYQLGGCANDARSWQRALEARGFAVTGLLNQQATRAAILQALTDMVTAAQPGDVIVFQYAGHGTQVDDVDGDERVDGLDEAFCPVDFPEGHFLIDDDVRSVFGRVHAGVNVTSFIDCCHSGSITRALVPGRRPLTALPPGSKPRFVPYSKDLSNLHRAFRGSMRGTEAAAPPAMRGDDVAPGTMVDVCFSACQSEEVAYETSGAGQFTTRAVRVLGESGRMTHNAFFDRVTALFGTGAVQHPVLDCAPASRTTMLLEPCAMPVTS